EREGAHVSQSGRTQVAQGQLVTLSHFQWMPTPGGQYLPPPVGLGSEPPNEPQKGPNGVEDTRGSSLMQSGPVRTPLSTNPNYRGMPSREPYTTGSFSATSKPGLNGKFPGERMSHLSEQRASDSASPSEHQQVPTAGQGSSFDTPTPSSLAPGPTRPVRTGFQSRFGDGEPGTALSVNPNGRRAGLEPHRPQHYGAQSQMHGQVNTGLQFPRQQSPFPSPSPTPSSLAMRPNPSPVPGPPTRLGGVFGGHGTAHTPQARMGPPTFQQGRNPPGESRQPFPKPKEYPSGSKLHSRHDTSVRGQDATGNGWNQMTHVNQAG
ncbi:unnamed protein product, partial [Discosporangium mesarthrocarpum]